MPSTTLIYRFLVRLSPVGRSLRLLLLCLGLLAAAGALPEAVAAPPVWSAQDSGTSVQLRDIHFLDGTHGWAAGAESTLLRTTNGGHTWHRVDTHGIDPANGFDSVQAIDAATVWAGGAVTVIRSTDAGTTWQNLTLTPGRLHNQLFPVSDTMAWGIGQGTDGGVNVHYYFRYVVNPDGASQESILSFPATGSLNSIQMLDENTGWSVGALGGIFKITGGSGPEPMITPQDSGIQVALYSVHMRDAQTGWVAGSQGTVLKTTDGGSTWTPLPTGVSTDLKAVFFSDAQTGWAAGDAGAIILTRDGGATWSGESSGVTAGLLGLHGAGPIYASGGAGTILKRSAGREYFFPRFHFEPGAWTEGFGFVNPGEAPAQIQFWQYGESGQLVAASTPVSWPARNQAAYQADGLLGLTAASTGWVLAQSDSSDPFGYFLTQRFHGGLAGLDGAEVFTGLITEGVFPRVRMTGTFSSELFLANPGPAPVQVTLTGHDGSNLLAGGTHIIPALGYLCVDAADIFAVPFDGFVHLEATGGVIGNLLLRDGDRSISSVNLQAVSFEPPVQDYNGSWNGLTNQAKKIAFLVEDNAISRISVEANFPECTVVVKDTHTFSPAVPIENGAFSITVSTTRLSYTIAGSFSSPTQASGTAQFSHTSLNPPCSSTVQATWSAETYQSDESDNPATARSSSEAALPPGASRAAELLYAPHIVRMPELYYTEVCLINPGNTAALATLSPVRADGTALVAPFDVSIPAGQCLVLRDEELGLPAGQNTEGWLKVECADQELTGCLTFGNPVDNHYMSTLPLLTTASSEQYFAQLVSGNAGGVNFFTGIAIINPNSQATDVNIAVYFSNGAINGFTSKTLAAGEKYVRLLKTIEDFQFLADQSSGYLAVRSTRPVFAFLLFGNDNLDFLSAVPAQF